MSIKTSFFIGCRYINARCDNRYASFLSLFSIIATALGIAVLTTVMSVMNGFEHDIKGLVYDFSEHVTISSPSGNISEWQQIADNLVKDKNVTSITPIIFTNAIISKDEEAIPSSIIGLEFQDELASYHNKSYPIILPYQYANKLNLSIGDKVLVMLPKFNSSITGIQPVMKNFLVVAIDNITKARGNIIVKISDLQKLLGMQNTVTNINVSTTSLEKAITLSKKLQQNTSITTTTWLDSHGQVFKALKLQKTMMFLILFLIIVIASFNMLSSMVMLVTDKRMSIATLRSLGMSGKNIIAIFMTQGIIIGLLGMLCGTILGVIMSNNVTAIVHALELLIGSKLIDKSVYMLDYLPSQIKIVDIAIINAATFILSAGATIYPAYRATKIKPAYILSIGK